MGSEAPPLAPGQEVGGYRIEELLHQGGMARIWRVTPLAADPGFPLILKEPRIGGGEDPTSIVGFEVEQMILPSLAGSHVPRYVARGDFMRQPFLVMERIPGATLRPRLDHAPLPLDEVASVGRRVAAALHELHRQGLVHLDIKPSNVMFREDGSAVLIDFGLSRHDALPDLLDEEFALPMGTAPYMSPEQLHHVRNDPRSDLFALGVMLYHFTTGHRPFGDPDSVRGLRQRLVAVPPSPRTLRPDCPPWLQEIILRCLEVDPAERWQSAAELALAFTDPASLPLTERAERSGRARPLRSVRNWLRTHGRLACALPAQGAAGQVRRHPIIMVAVDIDHAAAGLLEQMQETVRRIVVTEPGARLACVSVMLTGRIGPDDLVDAGGRSRHVKQLVALEHWARPIRRALSLEESRLTFHVLEGPNPAAAIIDFAERARVEHIVMGARGHSALRRYLGSVSSQVVAEAPCSVTVVRT